MLAMRDNVRNHRFGDSENIVLAHVPVQCTPFGEPVRPAVRHLIKHALSQVGFAVVDYEVESVRSIKELAQKHPQSLVFNLCYGLKATDHNPALSQPDVAATFEECGLRLVGSGSVAQGRCQDKLGAAEIAASLGIDSPRCFVLADALTQQGPLLIKPRSGAAHRGIQIVETPADLDAETHDPSNLIQEYLDGPEYTIGVLDKPGHGPQPLPLVRVRYQRQLDKPAVYEWASASMAPDSPNRFGLADLACELFDLFALQDYARFDFRAVRGRGPVLMDVNALPNLAPRQLLATSARWGGFQYPDLIAAIAWSAFERQRAVVS